MNGQDLEQLTLFPAASPASPFPWLESKKAKGMNATSGLKCSELSESLRRVGYSVRTYLESCELPPGTWSRTWSARALTSRCLILKLRLSARSTGERESRLLPTVTATVWEKGGPNQRDSSGRPGLQMAAQLWATPNTMDGLPPRSKESLLRQATTTRKGRTRPANLREQVDPETVALWQTPNVPNGGRVNPPEMSPTGMMPDGSKRQVGLEHQVKMVDAGLWPTPRASDYKGCGPAGSSSAEHFLEKGYLSGAVLYATPNARDWKNATAKEWDNPKNTRNLNRQIAKLSEGEQSTEARNGQLNPTWVEWLMGFPLGWTDLSASETP